MSYTITQSFIPNLPKENYAGGYGKYIGVIGHATATNGDSDSSERNFESTTFNNAFVHFFVDDTQIMQIADVNYLCFGAGATANRSGYVQVELCQTTNPAKFALAFDRYLWILAKLLKDKGLPVKDNLTLMSHAEVSAKWKETDHTDPIAYLATFGKTWADVVAGVTSYYNGATPAASVIGTAKELQQFLNELGYKGKNSLILNVDGGLGANTTFAVEAFQTAQKLAVDGNAGTNTWTALRAAVVKLSAPAAPVVKAPVVVAPVVANPVPLDNNVPPTGSTITPLMGGGWLEYATNGRVIWHQSRAIYLAISPDGHLDFTANGTVKRLV